MRVRRVKTVAIAAILLGSLAVASPSQAASRWVES
jgi:hypothetical protein